MIIKSYVIVMDIPIDFKANQIRRLKFCRKCKKYVDKYYFNLHIKTDRHKYGDKKNLPCIQIIRKPIIIYF